MNALFFSFSSVLFCLLVLGIWKLVNGGQIWLCPVISAVAQNAGQGVTAMRISVTTSSIISLPSC